MTTHSVEAYYRMLEVDAEASPEEIKKAYRKKAKELHPDSNTSPDAHEQFILLTEAYEYLSKRTQTEQNPASQSQEEYTAQAQEYYEYWQRMYREQARQQAAAYAQMNFEDFEKTSYYKSTQAAITIFEHFYFFSSITLILSPFWGYLYQGWAGFGVGFLITFLTVYYWAGVFTEERSLNFSLFVKSLWIVVKTKTFLYIALSCLNLYLLFHISLNAQLSIYAFLLILLGLYALAYLAFLKVAALQKLTKVALFLCCVPTLFNLFFLTNHAFSSEPNTEVYAFKHEEYTNVSRILLFFRTSQRKTSYIHLEGNQYEDYPWFRMFFDFEAMKDKQEISYKFEKGLFGIRVLKSYEFMK